MIPKTCQLCGTIGTEKLISLYWAWVNADGHRRAWKQNVCAECFRRHYAAAIVAAMEPILACPLCGEATVDDHDDVYVTYCVPGMPKDHSEMPCCGAHAAELRSLALTGATPLPDRGVGVGGLGPQPAVPDAETVWSSLGLRPRGA